MVGIDVTHEWTHQWKGLCILSDRASVDSESVLTSSDPFRPFKYETDWAKFSGTGVAIDVAEDEGGSHVELRVSRDDIDMMTQWTEPARVIVGEIVLLTGDLVVADGGFQLVDAVHLAPGHYGVHLMRNHHNAPRLSVTFRPTKLSTARSQELAT